jgi:hypothetical protein
VRLPNQPACGHIDGENIGIAVAKHGSLPIVGNRDSRPRTRCLLENPMSTPAFSIERVHPFVAANQNTAAEYDWLSRTGTAGKAECPFEL